jgi:hypothetical protein
MPAPPMDGAGGEPWPGYIYPGPGGLQRQGGGGGETPTTCHRRTGGPAPTWRRRGGEARGHAAPASSPRIPAGQQRRPSRGTCGCGGAESAAGGGGHVAAPGQWRLAACAGFTRAGAPRVPGYCVPGLACSLHGSVIRLGSLPSSLPAVHPPNATRPKDRIGTPTPTCTHLRRRSGTGRPAHVASSDAYIHACACMALFAKHLGVIWAMDDARTHVGNSHFAHRPEEEEVKTDSIAREMSMHGDRPIRFFLAHLRSTTCEESVGRSGRSACVCMHGHAGGHGAT